MVQAIRSLGRLVMCTAGALRVWAIGSQGFNDRGLRSPSTHRTAPRGGAGRGSDWRAGATKPLTKTQRRSGHANSPLTPRTVWGTDSATRLAIALIVSGEEIEGRRAARNYGRTV